MTFEELYKQYYHTIERFCNHQIGYDRVYSEQIADAVFDTLYEKWSGLESHEAAVLLTWLYKAATFKIKEFHRRRPPETIEYDDEYTQNLIEKRMREDASIPDETEENLKYKAYKAQIRTILKAKEREFFDCIVEEKLTYKQASHKLKISENAVKMRWMRLRVKIRPYVTELIEKNL